MTLRRVVLYALLSAVFFCAFLPYGVRASLETPPEGWTGIYEKADLEQISLFPEGRYILMNDIDLTGESLSGLCSEDAPFTGVLDGNGHTVYGISLSSATAPCGLFVSIWGGTVKNLTVAGSALGPIAGLLAGKLCDGALISCSVRGSVDATFCAGGLVGQISGEGVLLSDCSADVAVSLGAVLPEIPSAEENPSDSTDAAIDSSTDEVSEDTSSESSVEGTSSSESEGETECYLGGLVGAVYGSEIQILSCETAGSLTAADALLSAGGIVGVLDASATLSECGAEATLGVTPSSLAYVGGIVGRTGRYDVSLLNCSFRGDWSVPACDAVLDFGGIAGGIYAEGAVTVEGCVAFGSLACFAASSNVGGIVGSSVATEGSVTVSRCSSSATLTGGGDPLSMGGICGVNRGDVGTAAIVNCHADGALIHTEAPIREPSLFFGGICGLNGGEGVSTVSLCFSSCEVSVFYPIADGAVVGMSFPFTETAVATVTQCYYRDGVKEHFATPVSGSALSDPAAYVGFDFETVWQLDGSTGMPLLRQADPTDLPLPAGDVDGNRRLTAYDARLLSQYLTGRVTLTDGQRARADIDGDGDLDARDVSLILRNIS